MTANSPAQSSLSMENLFAGVCTLLNRVLKKVPHSLWDVTDTELHGLCKILYIMRTIAKWEILGHMGLLSTCHLSSLRPRSFRNEVGETTKIISTMR